MDNNPEGKTSGDERRSEPRLRPETYTNAEFRLKTVKCLFQSRIWDFSSQGMCLLVKEDSGALEDLEVGEELEVKYYPADLGRSPQTRKTRIAHITRVSEGKFKNHVLVGLRIVEEPGKPKTSTTTVV